MCSCGTGSVCGTSVLVELLNTLDVLVDGSDEVELAGSVVPRIVADAVELETTVPDVLDVLSIVDGPGQEPLSRMPKTPAHLAKH